MIIENRLRPISDDLRYGAYRGHLDVDWTLASGPNHPGVEIEMFGTWCPHCGQSWGWLVDLDAVLAKRREYEAQGCARCATRRTRPVNRDSPGAPDSPVTDMHREVRHSLDFERVAALPRRRLTLAQAERWAEDLTPMVALPRKGGRLLPWQAQSLAEIVDQAIQGRGALLGLPVGFGKTLLTWLTPLLLGAERPVLIAPAALREKTHADFESYLGVWRSPAPPPVFWSRKELELDRNQFRLFEVKPDLIMIDEADELANRDASAAARIDRYVEATTPRPIVVALTGTLIRLSIMGMWHLLRWCLGPGAPVPLREGEALSWAAALDERTRDPRWRPSPGPLGPTRKAAQAWFRQRLLETPGVVVVDGDSCDAPLRLETICAREDPKIDAAFERFHKQFENPGGLPVTDPLTRWMLDAQIGQGYYSYYDPEPPEEWRMAQRAAAKLVRDTIARTRRSSRPLDTERQVFQHYHDHPVVVAWREMREAFWPETRVAWFSRSMLDSCLEWLAAAPGTASIVWCGSVEFGHALAEESGLWYYGRQGRTDAGDQLHVADPQRSLIASWGANKKGFNLQPWRRALVVMPPQSAKWLEQLFGRHHRQGQTEPVHIYVMLGSGGTVDAFEAAIREARFAKSAVGLTQKILRAEIVRAKPRLKGRNRYRWASRVEHDPA